MVSVNEMGKKRAVLYNHTLLRAQETRHRRVCLHSFSFPSMSRYLTIIHHAENIELNWYDINPPLRSPLKKSHPHARSPHSLTHSRSLAHSLTCCCLLNIQQMNGGVCMNDAIETAERSQDPITSHSHTPFSPCCCIVQSPSAKWLSTAASLAAQKQLRIKALNNFRKRDQLCFKEQYLELASRPTFPTRTEIDSALECNQIKKQLISWFKLKIRQIMWILTGKRAAPEQM